MRSVRAPVLLTTFCLLVVIGTSLHADSAPAADSVTNKARWSELLVLSQRIVSDSNRAILGEERAFKSLQQARDRYDTILGVLKSGNPRKLSPEVLPLFHSLYGLWTSEQNVGVRSEVDKILSQKAVLLRLQTGAAAIDLKSQRVVALTEDISESGAATRAQPGFVFAVSRDAMLSQRIAKNAHVLSKGFDLDNRVVKEFLVDARILADSLEWLRKDSPKALIPKLDELEVTVRDIHKDARDMLADPAGLFTAHAAARTLSEGSELFLGRTRQLVDMLYLQDCKS